LFSREFSADQRADQPVLRFFFVGLRYLHVPQWVVAICAELSGTHARSFQTEVFNRIEVPVFRSRYRIRPRSITMHSGVAICNTGHTTGRSWKVRMAQFAG
jgi:hypothetical protein